MKFKSFIFSWFDNRRFQQFALGLNFATEEKQMLGEGATFEMLNYDFEIPMIYFREYYILFHLGFWQLAIGLSLYNKKSR